MARKSSPKRTESRRAAPAPDRTATRPGENGDRRTPTDGEQERAAERFADHRETDRDLTDEDVVEPARHKEGRAIDDGPARPADPDEAVEPPRR
jgi:hypothetical protein